MGDSRDSCDYVGRFAPSPSGPLHFGSVVAALASFLEARSRGGRWLVRIDDLDPPRVQQGAARSILETLAALGLTWDGAVTYQSQRHRAYVDTLAELERRHLIFPCACSRTDLAGGPYPGTCRGGIAPGREPRTLRVRVDDSPIEFLDRLQGRYAQQLAASVGDFVLRRHGGHYAYHLAVVVDDAEAGVTEVVRGIDLLDSTPRQIYLQRALGLATPSYAHIPVVLNEDGSKMSKQEFAAAIDQQIPGKVLCDALRFLRQDVPAELAEAAPVEILQHAVGAWNLTRVGADSRPFGSDAGADR